MRRSRFSASSVVAGEFLLHRLCPTEGLGGHVTEVVLLRPEHLVLSAKSARLAAPNKRSQQDNHQQCIAALAAFTSSAVYCPDLGDSASADGAVTLHRRLSCARGIHRELDAHHCPFVDLTDAGFPPVRLALSPDVTLSAAAAAAAAVNCWTARSSTLDRSLNGSARVRFVRPEWAPFRRGCLSTKLCDRSPLSGEARSECLSCRVLRDHEPVANGGVCSGCSAKNREQSGRSAQSGLSPRTGSQPFPILLGSKSQEPVASSGNTLEVPRTRTKRRTSVQGCAALFSHRRTSVAEMSIGENTEFDISEYGSDDQPCSMTSLMEKIEGSVMDALRNMIGGDIDADSTFLEAGLDSTLAPSFMDTLQRRKSVSRFFEGAPPTSSALVYNYPTPKAFAMHLSELVSQIAKVVASPAYTNVNIQESPRSMCRSSQLSSPPPPLREVATEDLVEFRSVHAQAARVVTWQIGADEVPLGSWRRETVPTRVSLAPRPLQAPADPSGALSLLRVQSCHKPLGLCTPKKLASLPVVEVIPEQRVEILSPRRCTMTKFDTYETRAVAGRRPHRPGATYAARFREGNCASAQRRRCAGAVARSAGEGVGVTAPAGKLLFLPLAAEPRSQFARRAQVVLPQADISCSQALIGAQRHASRRLLGWFSLVSSTTVYAAPCNKQRSFSSACVLRCTAGIRLGGRTNSSCCWNPAELTTTVATATVSQRAAGAFFVADHREQMLESCVFRIAVDDATPSTIVFSHIARCKRARRMVPHWDILQGSGWACQSRANAGSELTRLASTARVVPSHVRPAAGVHLGALQLRKASQIGPSTSRRRRRCRGALKTEANGTANVLGTSAARCWLALEGGDVPMVWRAHGAEVVTRFTIRAALHGSSRCMPVAFESGNAVLDACVTPQVYERDVLAVSKRLKSVEVLAARLRVAAAAPAWLREGGASSDAVGTRRCFSVAFVQHMLPEEASAQAEFGPHLRRGARIDQVASPPAPLRRQYRRSVGASPAGSFTAITRLFPVGLCAAARPRSRLTFEELRPLLFAASKRHFTAIGGNESSVLLRKTLPCDGTLGGRGLSLLLALSGACFHRLHSCGPQARHSACVLPRLAEVGLREVPDVEAARMLFACCVPAAFVSGNYFRWSYGGPPLHRPEGPAGATTDRGITMPGPAIRQLPSKTSLSVSGGSSHRRAGPPVAAPLFRGSWLLPDACSDSLALPSAWASRGAWPGRARQEVRETATPRSWPPSDVSMARPLMPQELSPEHQDRRGGGASMAGGLASPRVHLRRKLLVLHHVQHGQGSEPVAAAWEATATALVMPAVCCPAERRTVLSSQWQRLKACRTWGPSEGGSCDFGRSRPEAGPGEFQNQAPRWLGKALGIERIGFASPAFPHGAISQAAPERDVVALRSGSLRKLAELQGSRCRSTTAGSRCLGVASWPLDERLRTSWRSLLVPASRDCQASPTWTASSQSRRIGDVSLQRFAGNANGLRGRGWPSGARRQRKAAVPFDGILPGLALAPGTILAQRALQKHLLCATARRRPALEETRILASILSKVWAPFRLGSTSCGVSVRLRHSGRGPRRERQPSFPDRTPAHSPVHSRVPATCAWPRPLSSTCTYLDARTLDVTRSCSHPLLSRRSLFLAEFLLGLPRAAGAAIEDRLSSQALHSYSHPLAAPQVRCLQLVSFPDASGSAAIDAPPVRRRLPAAAATSGSRRTPQPTPDSVALHQAVGCWETEGWLARQWVPQVIPRSTDFSSSSALFGLGSGADYACSNGVVDAVAASRQVTMLASTNVHWGAVPGLGLAADARALAEGLTVDVFGALFAAAWRLSLQRGLGRLVDNSGISEWCIARFLPSVQVQRCIVAKNSCLAPPRVHERPAAGAFLGGAGVVHGPNAMRLTLPSLQIAWREIPGCDDVSFSPLRGCPLAAGAGAGARARASGGSALLRWASRLPLAGRQARARWTRVLGKVRLSSARGGNACMEPALATATQAATSSAAAAILGMKDALRSTPSKAKHRRTSAPRAAGSREPQKGWRQRPVMQDRLRPARFAWRSPCPGIPRLITADCSRCLFACDIASAAQRGAMPLLGCRLPFVAFSVAGSQPGASKAPMFVGAMGRAKADTQRQLASAAACGGTAKAAVRDVLANGERTWRAWPAPASPQRRRQGPRLDKTACLARLLRAIRAAAMRCGAGSFDSGVPSPVIPLEDGAALPPTVAATPAATILLPVVAAATTGSAGAPEPAAPRLAAAARQAPLASRLLSRTIVSESRARMPLQAAAWNAETPHYVAKFASVRQSSTATTLPATRPEEPRHQVDEGNRSVTSARPIKARASRSNSSQQRAQRWFAMLHWPRETQLQLNALATGQPFRSSVPRRRRLARAAARFGHDACSGLPTNALLRTWHERPGLAQAVMLHRGGHASPVQGKLSHHQAPVVAAMYEAGGSSLMPRAVVELRNPKRFNAMDEQLFGSLGCALAALERVASRGCSFFLLVQAMGSHFCTGGRGAHNEAEGSGLRCSRMAAVAQIVSCAERVGVVSAAQCGVLHGTVVGGGVAFALMLKNRVAAASCTLSFGNLSRGVCPVLQLSQRLPGAVGQVAAMGIYLEDGIMDASRAREYGLVQETHGRVEQALRSAHGMAAQLLRNTQSMQLLAAMDAITGYHPLSSSRACQRAAEIVGHVATLAVGEAFYPTAAAAVAKDSAVSGDIGDGSAAVDADAAISADAEPLRKPSAQVVTQQQSMLPEQEQPSMVPVRDSHPAAPPLDLLPLGPVACLGGSITNGTPGRCGRLAGSLLHSLWRSCEVATVGSLPEWCLKDGGRVALDESPVAAAAREGCESTASPTPLRVQTTPRATLVRLSCTSCRRQLVLSPGARAGAAGVVTRSRSSADAPSVAASPWPVWQAEAGCVSRGVAICLGSSLAVVLAGGSCSRAAKARCSRSSAEPACCHDLRPWLPSVLRALTSCALDSCAGMVKDAPLAGDHIDDTMFLGAYHFLPPQKAAESWAICLSEVSRRVCEKLAGRTAGVPAEARVLHQPASVARPPDLPTPAAAAMPAAALAACRGQRCTPGSAALFPMDYETLGRPKADAPAPASSQATPASGAPQPAVLRHAGADEALAGIVSLLLGAAPRRPQPQLGQLLKPYCPPGLSDPGAVTPAASLARSIPPSCLQKDIRCSLGTEATGFPRWKPNLPCKVRFSAAPCSAVLPCLAGGHARRAPACELPLSPSASVELLSYGGRTCLDEIEIFCTGNTFAAPRASRRYSPASSTAFVPRALFQHVPVRSSVLELTKPHRPNRSGAHHLLSVDSIVPDVRAWRTVSLERPCLLRPSGGVQVAGFHGGDGDVLGLTWGVFRSDDFVFTALSYDTNAFMQESMAALAQLYYQRIVAVSAAGPAEANAIFVALSIGCMIAQEVALVSASRGCPLVRGILFIDMQVSGIPRTADGMCMAVAMLESAGSTAPSSLGACPPHRLADAGAASALLSIRRLGRQSDNRLQAVVSSLAANLDRLQSLGCQYSPTAVFTAPAQLLVAAASYGFHNGLETNPRHCKTLGVAHCESDHFRCVLSPRTVDAFNVFLRKMGQGQTSQSRRPLHAGHLALSRVAGGRSARGTTLLRRGNPRLMRLGTAA